MDSDLWPAQLAHAGAMSHTQAVSTTGHLVEAHLCLCGTGLPAVGRMGSGEICRLSSSLIHALHCCNGTSLTGVYHSFHHWTSLPRAPHSHQPKVLIFTRAHKICCCMDPICLLHLTVFSYGHVSPCAHSSAPLPMRPHLPPCPLHPCVFRLAFSLMFSSNLCTMHGLLHIYPGGSETHTHL